MGKEKYYNIELMKFVFCIIIIYFHILNFNIIPYMCGQSEYIMLQGITNKAPLIVECFLILGGFFLYSTFKNKPEKTFIEFTLDRIARLWPVLAFYTIIYTIFFKENVENAFFDLFFLRCTGLTFEQKGIIWYIGPFFWGSILIFGILKCIEKKKAGLLLALIAFIGCAININYTNGTLILTERKTIYNFLNLGFVKVLSGLSIGCIIGIVLELYQKKFYSMCQNKKYSILISTIEIVSFVLLLIYFLTDLIKIKNGLFAVILFSVLLICMINKKAFFSTILNRKVFGILGRYTYSIYVMQQIAFDILKKTLWNYNELVYFHPYATLLISIIFCVLVGIMVYYLIEKTSMKFYNNWLKKYSKQ